VFPAFAAALAAVVAGEEWVATGLGPGAVGWGPSPGDWGAGRRPENCGMGPRSLDRGLGGVDQEPEAGACRPSGGGHIRLGGNNLLKPGKRVNRRSYGSEVDMAQPMATG